MGLTTPFQIAMMKHIADEEPLDPKWYEESGEKSYSIHNNTLR